MPIISTDLVWRWSVAAAAGDTTASSASASLGDQVASNGPTSGAANNFWDDVSSSEAAAGDVEYRCGFVLNNHGTLTHIGSVLSILSETAGGASIAIGADPTAASAKGSASAQAVTIANEQTAPAGVTFGTSPAALGDIPAGFVKAFWVRRTVPAGAGLLADGAVLSVDGDTNP